MVHINGFSDWSKFDHQTNKPLNAAVFLLYQTKSTLQKSVDIQSCSPTWPWSLGPLKIQLKMLTAAHLWVVQLGVVQMGVDRHNIELVSCYHLLSVHSQSTITQLHIQSQSLNRYWYFLHSTDINNNPQSHGLPNMILGYRCIKAPFFKKIFVFVNSCGLIFHRCVISAICYILVIVGIQINNRLEL